MTVRAIIDVGTNSTKMLVVDGDTDVLRDLTPARLGEGLASTGRLSDDAMSRTLEVIDAFAGRARELGATDITIVGTAACRRASNTTSFAAMVRDRSVNGTPTVTWPGSMLIRWWPPTKSNAPE